MGTGAWPVHISISIPDPVNRPISHIPSHQATEIPTHHPISSNIPVRQCIVIGKRTRNSVVVVVVVVLPSLDFTLPLGTPLAGPIPIPWLLATYDSRAEMGIIVLMLMMM